MDNKWTISFLAEKEGERHDRKVVMRVLFSGTLIRYLVGYRVDCTPTKPVKDSDKKFECRWDWDKQRCKANTTHGKYKASVINNKIDAMEKKASSILEQYYFGTEKRLPTVNEFRNEYEDVKQKDVTFFSALDEFMNSGGENESWSKAVYNKFHALKNHLKRYNPKLTFEFNIDDANALIRWYIKNGYRNTTTKKNSDLLKWFLRWASEKGYYTGNVHTKAWKIKLKKVTNKEIIYLEWDEVMQLWNFTPYKYEPEEEDELTAIGAETLQHVKDCFLFQCFTGLRFSDLKDLKRSQITDDAVKIVTQKTGDSLIINLNEFSRAILDKYKDIPFKNDAALPVISNQKMNDYLKVLCKEAEINTPYTDTYFIGGNRYDVTVPKWEIISTHAGRRTFVVTGLTLEIDPLTIMQWTGHKNIEAMKPYMKIVDEKKKAGAGKFDELFSEI
ncbi:MAG: site-specific integrase [Bacteroidia bacterium]|nr:site-specific integrase [Bacteroidia bacterium]